MDFELEIDTKPLLNLLDKLPDEVAKKVVRNATAAGARVIRDRAKELAPYDENRQKGTHLRDAIIVRKLKGTNDVQRIGVDGRKGPHGHLQEYGTVKHPPQAFLRPAADETKEEVARIMVKRLYLGIFREAKKLAGA